ncbi:putative Tle1 phospholipase domain-containing protein, partial [Seiridium cardinale]
CVNVATDVRGDHYVVRTCQGHCGEVSTYNDHTAQLSLRTGGGTIQKTKERKEETSVGQSSAAARTVMLRFWSSGTTGTWAGGVLSSRKTVVSEFVKLISDHENVVEVPVNGVGSDIGALERIKGGIGGWGTLRNVVIAMRNLSKQYRPGDRIIILGYSRGAWAARYLAMLIDITGLPKDGDEHFFHELYKACDKGFILNEELGAKLSQNYECWKNVKINALCCFDTVGSLGLPLTGLVKPIALLMRARNNNDIVSDIASNVETAFHCLSLHETRGPYRPSLMRGHNVHQVFFPGNHQNLGWIDEKEGLVHAPFAWMIQQLATHLGLSFDETKLAARFPSSRLRQPSFSYAPPPANSSSRGGRDNDHDPPSSPSANQPLDIEPKWCQGRILPHSLALLAIIGKESRKPGRLYSAGEATDVKVHIGARLRTALGDVNAVPGYTLMAPVTGRPYWARRRRSHTRWLWPRNEPTLSWSSSDDDGVEVPEARRLKSSPRMARRVEEAEIGPLEAMLLGLPEDVVNR